MRKYIIKIFIYFSFHWIQTPTWSLTKYNWKYRSERQLEAKKREFFVYYINYIRFMNLCFWWLISRFFENLFELWNITNTLYFYSNNMSESSKWKQKVILRDIKNSSVSCSEIFNYVGKKFHKFNYLYWNIIPHIIIKNTEW